MSVTPEEYIKTRLDEQITWYSRKSSQNQRMHKRLQLLIVISSTSIPFLSAYSSEYSIFQIIVGIIGVMVAALTAINSLYKYQENWISYRSIAESLKQQKFLYLTGTDPYHETHAFHMLVQQVEMLISKENSTWTQQMEQTKDRKMTPASVA